MSNTISVIEPGLLRPETHFDLAALASYRKDMLEAYTDLLAGFLQYLKDCLFDHFVVRCPQPTGDEVLELACISIRDKQVYKVCNFSRRRYVKSFPTVEYWLSAIPVLPAIKLAFGRIACSVLAPAFSKLSVDEGGDDRVSVDQLQQLLNWAQSTDVLGRARELRGRSDVATRAAGFALSRMQPEPPATPVVLTTDLVGQPADHAADLLVERGLGVRREALTGAAAAGGLVDVASLMRRPRPGDEVTLFEDESGAVRSFAVRPSTATGGPVLSAATDLTDRVTSLEAELDALRRQLGSAPRKTPARGRRRPRLRPRPLGRPRPPRASAHRGRARAPDAGRASGRRDVGGSQPALPRRRSGGDRPPAAGRDPRGEPEAAAQRQRHTTGPGRAR